MQDKKIEDQIKKNGKYRTKCQGFYLACCIGGMTKVRIENSIQSIA